MNVIEQPSNMRDNPQWQVSAGDEWYAVRAGDSEDAAWLVAHHLGFRPKDEDEAFSAMHFRCKNLSTRLRLPDGRYVESEPFGYSEEPTQEQVLR